VRLCSRWYCGVRVSISQKEQHWNNEVDVSERPRSNAYVLKRGHTQAPPPEGPSRESLEMVAFASVTDSLWSSCYFLEPARGDNLVNGAVGLKKHKDIHPYYTRQSGG